MLNIRPKRSPVKGVSLEFLLKIGPAREPEIGPLPCPVCGEDPQVWGCRPFAQDSPYCGRYVPLSAFSRLPVIEVGQ